jgi:hypothetical protein
MIELTPEQWQALRDILAAIFDRAGLAELVRFNFPYRLDVLVDETKPLAAVILDLMEALEQRGELEALLRGAVKARPKSEPLIALCRTVAPQVFTPVDTRGLITQVTVGLEALTDLKAAPEVWAKVGESQAIFRAVMVQTAILAAYKSLHDGLHNLQMRLGAIEAAAGTFTSVVAQARLLGQQAVYLTGDADRAAAYATSVPTRTQEEDWIDELRDAANEIRLSLGARDAARMGRAVVVLRRLLQESYRIDGQMASSASLLRLGDLITALTAIAGKSSEKDGAAGPAASQVKAAHGALTTLRPRLEGLIAEHGEWQVLNKALAGVETNPGFRPEEKVNRWARVKERIAGLCRAFQAAPWSGELINEIAKWEEAAAAGQSDQGEVAAGQVYASASNRFFDVDQDLLKLCGQLTDIGNPIEVLLSNLSRPGEVTS